MEPFWEGIYEDPDAHAFGPPSEELVALLPRLPVGAEVLDLGCGDGRNALVFAAAGFHVRALDKSRAGIERLRSRALRRGLAIVSEIRDLTDYSPDGSFDLVITHGVLHLLEPGPCERLLGDVRAATRRGGWNVHVVFTDRLPQPDDLAAFVHRPFREGELRERYVGWEIELFRSYTLEDEHPGGIRHRHAINKIVARKP